MPEIYKTADDHVLAERLSLGMKSITLKQFLSGGGLMQCFLLYFYWESSRQLFFGKSSAEQLFLMRSSTVVKSNVL